MKKLWIVCVALTLSACASPPSHKVAVMHNPATGDTQRCEIDPWATWQWQYKEVLAQCIKGYERSGYQRVDQ